MRYSILLLSLATALCVMMLAGCGGSGSGTFSVSTDNLLTNGGFESGTNGWTTNNVDLVGYWQAHGGAAVLDLSGDNAGSIYQDVTTVPGGRYRISFYLAGNPSGGPTVKSLNLFWGGVKVDTPTFDTTGYSPGNMGWTLHQYDLIATSTTTRLEFDSLTYTAYGPALDDIGVFAMTPNP